MELERSWKVAMGGGFLPGETVFSFTVVLS